MSAVASSAAPRGGKKISSVSIAKPFREGIRQTIIEKYGGVGPKLVGFLANDDPAARSYAQWTKTACRPTDPLEIRTVEKTASRMRCTQPTTSEHGIMIYYPCFAGTRPAFTGPTWTTTSGLDLCQEGRRGFVLSVPKKLVPESTLAPTNRRGGWAT